jgi:FdhD protein
LKATETVSVRKLDLRSHRDEVVSEEAAVEVPVTISVNGKEAATLFTTPSDQAELAIGYLIGEGILKRYSDIRNIICSDATTSVNVETKPRAQVRIKAAKVIKALNSACGSSGDFYRLLDRIDKPIVRSDYRVSASEVIQIVTEFNKQSQESKRVGSLQYAAIFFENKMKAFFGDVGLDNAVNKALGAILKTGLDPGRTIIISSGRQSATEVIRTARVGSPVILSVRGPTYSGVRAAEKTGVTLCCFVTESSMNLYSGFERIILNSRRPPTRAP